jgi:hypothetical protein
MEQENQVLQTNVIVNHIYAYWTRFLICGVVVKARSEKSRKCLVIHNLVSNLRKKSNDFSKKIISMVLQGNQSLVDLALVDSCSIKLFEERNVLYSLQGISSEMVRSVSHFHNISSTKSFCSPSARLQIGTDLEHLFFNKISGYKETIPFMRLDIKRELEQRGKQRPQMEWYDGENFVQNLFRILREQVHIVEHVQEKCMKTLQNMVDEHNPIPNDCASDFDLTWENFLKIHPFFQEKPFDIPKYCFEWKPEMSSAFDLYGGEIQQTIKEVNDPTNEREQPSLSLKLSFIQMAFQSMFTQLVNTFH